MSPVELIKVAQQCAGGLTAATTTAAAAATTDIGSVSVVVQRIVGSSSSSSTIPWWNCGLNATLLRDGIPHGVWFATYELTKDVMLSSLKSNSDTTTTTSLKEVAADDESLPVVVPLVSGKTAVCSCLCWIIHLTNIITIATRHNMRCRCSSCLCSLVR